MHMERAQQTHTQVERGTHRHTPKPWVSLRPGRTHWPRQAKAVSVSEFEADAFVATEVRD